MTQLHRIGLNEQQARAYLALLDTPRATVHELAKTSRVPRAKLYEVLQSLLRKGLVTLIPESPQRYAPSPLNSYFEARLMELRADETNLRRVLGELTLYFSLQDQGRKPDADTSLVQVSFGRTHFPTLARQLITNARTSLTLLGDRLLLPRLRVYEDVIPLLARQAQHLSVKILVPANAEETLEGRRVYLDELVPQIRRAPVDLGDVCVLVRDQEEYVLTHFFPNDLHPSRGSDRVIQGLDPAIASTWGRITNAAWDASTPWAAPRSDAYSRSTT